MLARYVQVVVGIPSLSFLVAVSLPLFVLLVATGFQQGRRFWVRSPFLWFLAGLHFCRVLANMLGAKYTEATNVQLLALAVPFLVVALNRILLKESTPRYTKRAVVLSALGGLLVLGDDLRLAGSSGTELIGIAFAMLASLLFATYLIAVRKGALSDISPGRMLVFQGGAMLVPSLILSLAFAEDWSVWTRMPVAGWIAVVVFTLVVPISTNLLNLSAVSRIGAPAVSSMMPWRLVVTLAVGGIVLGERLVGPWQVSGALLVLCTVTWYLWMRRVGEVRT